MDLMDYTMDNAHLPPQREPSCPHLQSQHPSNSYTHQPRDSHRYDPVHNAEAWYHSNAPNSHPMASYGPSNVPWSPSHFTSIQSWNGLGGETTFGGLGLDGAPYMNRSHSVFTGVSPSGWTSMGNYDSLPFGYSSFNGMPSDNNGPSESNPNRNSAPVSTASAAAGQVQLRLPQASMDDYLRSSNRAHSTSNASPRSQVDYPDGQMQERILQESSQAVLREDRRTQNQARISQRVSSTVGTEEARRQRHASGPSSSRLIDTSWESDEDDSAGLSRQQIEMYHRHADAAFSPGIHDERTLAALRGSMAASKKIPSKEAIASLETVDPKDLPESDKICIICYNELGVENPEGVVEAPLRLPKCKHIFGEKCIKKWFEDCDSCPYCRDKLPSNSAAVKRAATIEHLRYRQVTTRDSSTRSRPRVPETFSNGGSELSYLRHTQDEFNFFMASRATEPWAYTPANHRSFATESSPESRRRQARGRVGYGRAIYSGRPMSVGSARPTTQGAVGHPSSQRLNDHGTNSQESDLAIHPPRRSVTPGLSSQNSGSNSAEASPAIAVGSGTSAGDRMVNFRGDFSDYPHWPMSPFSVDSSSGVGAFANAISSAPPNPVTNRYNNISDTISGHSQAGWTG